MTKETLSGADGLELTLTTAGDHASCRSQNFFTASEKNLVSLLGVPRAELRRLRMELIEGEDWTMAGNTVRYSESGIKKTRAALELPQEAASNKIPVNQPAMSAEAADGPVPIESAPIKNPAEKTFRVRQTVANHKILLATDGVSQIRVRVHSSVNFLPGMAIPCRHIKDDLWELARRCPRWRGRW
jgi:hypothetical protein